MTLRPALAALLSALVLLAAGCSKVSTDEAAAPAAAGQTGAAGTFLAYEHSVLLEVPEAGLAERMAALREACTAQRHGDCSLLRFEETSRGGGRGGLVVARMAPDAVAPWLAQAGDGGRTVSSSTHAEDLADSVRDLDRQRRRIEAQQARLDELETRGPLSASDLIAVATERARLDTELAGLAQADANVTRRLETNLVSVRFQTDGEGAFARLGEAFVDLDEVFVDGLIEALEIGVAGLPFVLLAFPLALLWRWGWRRATGAVKRERAAARAASAP